MTTPSDSFVPNEKQFDLLLGITRVMRIILVGFFAVFLLAICLYIILLVAIMIMFLQAPGPSLF